MPPFTYNSLRSVRVGIPTYTTFVSVYIFIRRHASHVERFVFQARKGVAYRESYSHDLEPFPPFIHAPFGIVQIVWQLRPVPSLFTEGKGSGTCSGRNVCGDAFESRPMARVVNPTMLRRVKPTMAAYTAIRWETASALILV